VVVKSANPIQQAATIGIQAANDMFLGGAPNHTDWDPIGGPGWPGVYSDRRVQGLEPAPEDEVGLPVQVQSS
jgi:hypothetical protein